MNANSKQQKKRLKNPSQSWQKPILVQNQQEKTTGLPYTSDGHTWRVGVLQKQKSLESVKLELPVFARKLSVDLESLRKSYNLNKQKDGTVQSACMIFVC